MRGWITDPKAEGGLRLASDLPEPHPAPGELVLGVWAYSVNRGELSLLEQRPEGWRPGQDVAGVVTRAAADGSGPLAGARVVGVVDGGGWSERVAVPTRWAAVLPEDVPFDQAAALPIAGLTALRALRRGGDLIGRRVLVTGSTGGVGQLAVQLAVAAGAHVTAQVSAPDRAQAARALGAEAVTDDLESEGLGRFDLVLDGVAGEILTQAVHLLAPEATAVTYGTVGGKAELGLLDFAGAPGAKVVGHFFAVPEATRGADLATLAGFVADGRVRPVLGDIRSWEHTPEVIAALRERRVRGKAVLTR